MLVLSRKKSERIWFPAFHTAVEVVEIHGGTVRLGIQAPREVTVLRAEVPDKGAQGAAMAPAPEWRQLLVNRLSLTESGLLRVSQHLRAGQVEDAQAILEQFRDECRMLRRRLEGEVGKRPLAEAPKRRSCRALLVEDNQNERELLAGLLRISGVEVATAGDGADALDYLRTHAKPDVVLLDMGLPRLDGAATLREIRRQPALAGLKVIGVSGHQAEEFNLEQSPRGVHRWFQKPVNPAELLHELQGAVCGV
jgi:carbon storage regulator CsrA